MTTKDFRGFRPAATPYGRPSNVPPQPHARAMGGSDFPGRGVQSQVASQVQGPPQQPKAQELQSYQESAFVGPLWKNYMEEMANVFGRALGSDVDIKIENPEKFGGVVKAVTELKQNWQSQGLDEIQAGNAAFETIFQAMAPGVTLNEKSIAPGVNFKLAEDPLKAAFPPPTPKTQAENLAEVVKYTGMGIAAPQLISKDQSREYEQSLHALMNPLIPMIPESFVGETGGANRVARQVVRELSSPLIAAAPLAIPKIGMAAKAALAPRAAGPWSAKTAIPKIATKLAEPIPGGYPVNVAAELGGEVGAGGAIYGAQEAGYEPNLAGQIGLGVLGGLGGFVPTGLTARGVQSVTPGGITGGINLKHIADLPPAGPEREAWLDEYEAILTNQQERMMLDRTETGAGLDRAGTAASQRFGTVPEGIGDDVAFSERTAPSHEIESAVPVSITEQGIFEIDPETGGLTVNLEGDPNRAAGKFNLLENDELQAHNLRRFVEDRTPEEVASPYIRGYDHEAKAFPADKLDEQYAVVAAEDININHHGELTNPQFEGQTVPPGFSGSTQMYDTDGVYIVYKKGEYKWVKETVDKGTENEAVVDRARINYNTANPEANTWHPVMAYGLSSIRNEQQLRTHQPKRMARRDPETNDPIWEDRGNPIPYRHNLDIYGWRPPKAGETYGMFEVGESIQLFTRDPKTGERTQPSGKRNLGAQVGNHDAHAMARTFEKAVDQHNARHPVFTGDDGPVIGFLGHRIHVDPRMRDDYVAHDWITIQKAARGTPKATTDAETGRFVSGFQQPRQKDLATDAAAVGPASAIVRGWDDVTRGLQASFPAIRERELEDAVSILKKRAMVADAARPGRYRSRDNREWARERFAGFNVDGLILMNDGRILSPDRIASGIDASTAFINHDLPDIADNVVRGVIGSNFPASPYPAGESVRPPLSSGTITPRKEEIITQMEAMWHEIGHIIRKDIWDLDRDAYAVLRRFSGMPDLPKNTADWGDTFFEEPPQWENWTRDAEEKFARGFVEWLSEYQGKTGIASFSTFDHYDPYNRDPGLSGETPAVPRTGNVDNAFKRIANWIRHVAYHDGPGATGTGGRERLTEVEFKAFDAIMTESADLANPMAFRSAGAPLDREVFREEARPYLGLEEQPGVSPRDVDWREPRDTTVPRPTPEPRTQRARQRVRTREEALARQDVVTDAELERGRAIAGTAGVSVTDEEAQGLVVHRFNLGRDANPDEIRAELQRIRRLSWEERMHLEDEWGDYLEVRFLDDAEGIDTVFGEAGSGAAGRLLTAMQAQAPEAQARAAREGVRRQQDTSGIAAVLDDEEAGLYNVSADRNRYQGPVTRHGQGQAPPDDGVERYLNTPIINHSDIEIQEVGRREAGQTANRWQTERNQHRRFRVYHPDTLETTWLTLDFRRVPRNEQRNRGLAGTRRMDRARTDEERRLQGYTWQVQVRDLEGAATRMTGVSGSASRVMEEGLLSELIPNIIKTIAADEGFATATGTRMLRVIDQHGTNILDLPPGTPVSRADITGNVGQHWRARRSGEEFLSGSRLFLDRSPTNADAANPYGDINARNATSEDRHSQALVAARERQGFGDPSSGADVELEKRAWRGRQVPFLDADRLLRGSITEKFLAAIRNRAPATKETIELRHQEKQRFAGRATGVRRDPRYAGREAAARAHSALHPRGSRDTTDIQFEPLDPEVFTEADIHIVFEWINRNPNWREYTKDNTARAIFKLIDGKDVTRFDIKRLQAVFGKDVTAALFDTRGFKRKAFDEIMDILGIPRLLLATLDFSAPLRQGLLSLGGHPVRWTKTTGPAFRAALSGDYEAGLRSRRENHKNYGLFTGQTDVAAGEGGGFGLHQTDPDGMMSDREEAFMSRFLQKMPDRAGKIPVIGATAKPLLRGAGKLMGYPIRFSDRGYNSFLNELRFNLMNDAWESWKASGKGFDKNGKPTAETVQDAKHLARWFNISTGRGDLGAAEPLAPLLSNILFSPRLAAARLETPYELFRLDHSMRVKQHVVRDVAGTTMLGTTVLGLAAMAGADVDLDPTSSDFGRIQVGNSRVDIWGGFQPLVRTMFRLGQMRRKSTGTGKSTDLDAGGAANEIWSFWRNKLAPVPGFGADVLGGGTFTGDEINWEEENVKRELWNRFVPLMLQDLEESYASDGVRGMWLAAPSFFGTSVISYQGVEELVRRDYKYPDGRTPATGVDRLTESSYSMFQDLPPFLQDHAIYMNKFETSRSETEFSELIEKVDHEYWTELVGIISDTETSDSVKVSQYFDAGNTRADKRAGAFETQYGTFEGERDEPANANEEALQQYYNMIEDSTKGDYSFDNEYFNATFEALIGKWTKEQEQWVRANTNNKDIPKAMFDLLPDKQKENIEKSNAARKALTEKWAKSADQIAEEQAGRRPDEGTTLSEIEQRESEITETRNKNRAEAGLPAYVPMQGTGQRRFQRSPAWIANGN